MNWKLKLLIPIITISMLYSTELKRSNWNLLSICEDINSSQIDMKGIKEIQSQDGKSIYTGDWTKYSNLDKLEAGYGYWVKGDKGSIFDTGDSNSTIQKSLRRDGWNLMASCENIYAKNINMNGIVEIQSQDGKSIYTGDWAKYSNLDKLEAGYGYWVKGAKGIAWTSKEDNSSTSINSKYHNVLGMSLKFYEAQRAIGPFPTVNWRKPASTHDGNDVGVDLNGGWFDAGDHVKFSLPMSYAVGMINWSILKTPKAYEDIDKMQYAKEQVKYALDYLLKTYQEGDSSTPNDDKIYFQVSDGNVDHIHWVPPEEINYERKTFVCDADGGCAVVAGAMAGAFASASIIFKNDNPTYSQELLDKAKQLYEFTNKYPNDGDYPGEGQENFYKLYSPNKDQVAWGAIWLYKATNDSKYLNKAKELMENEYPWGLSWDNMNSAVLLMLAEITNEQKYKDRIEKEVDRWLNTVPTTPAGLKVILKWGSLRHASAMAFISLLYSDMVDESKKKKFIDFGKSQIDYILGDNPQHFSYIVGYGDNYPKYPHHRAASGTKSVDDPAPNKYIIEGALVGGPKSARDEDYQDKRDDYVDNEVAVDYNAAFRVH